MAPPRCPLQLRKDLEVASLLLEAKAGQDKATNHGFTRMFYAAQKGHLELARLLMDAKADKDKATSDGATPLFIAVQNGHLEVARLLLEAKADKDKAMNDGAAPFFFAASTGRFELARLFLEANMAFLVSLRVQQKANRSFDWSFAALIARSVQKRCIKAILNAAQKNLYEMTATGKGEDDLLELEKKFEVKIIGADDIEDCNISVHFQEIADFIEAGRKKGGVVIHCAAGVSRASTSCMAYMMIKEHWSLQAAHRRVHAVRSIIHSNSGFWRQLNDLQASLIASGVTLRELPSDYVPPEQPLRPGEEARTMTVNTVLSSNKYRNSGSPALCKQ
eukprot:s663_g19.t1